MFVGFKELMFDFFFVPARNHMFILHQISFGLAIGLVLFISWIFFLLPFFFLRKCDKKHFYRSFLLFSFLFSSACQDDISPNIAGVWRDTNKNFFSKKNLKQQKNTYLHTHNIKHISEQNLFLQSHLNSF